MEQVNTKPSQYIRHWLTEIVFSAITVLSNVSNFKEAFVRLVDNRGIEMNRVLQSFVALGVVELLIFAPYALAQSTIQSGQVITYTGTSCSGTDSNSTTATSGTCNSNSFYGGSSGAYYANADYGHLGVAASMLGSTSVPENPDPSAATLEGGWAYSSASFGDMVTISSGGALAGQTGFLTFSVDLNVALDPSSFNAIWESPYLSSLVSSEYAVRADVYVNTFWSYLQTATGTTIRQDAVGFETSGFSSAIKDGQNVVSVLGTTQYTVPFAFDTPFSLAMDLSLEVNAEAFWEATSRLGIDATHSFDWAGINQVTDSAGNLVDFSLSSASGTDYRQSFVPSVTAPVPEPEAYAMLMAGLGFLGVIARRRSSPT